MGSILGAIVSGFALGLIEGLTKVFYPEASSTVIFVIMALVLLVKPGRPVRAGRAEVRPKSAHGQPSRYGCGPVGLIALRSPRRSSSTRCS